MQWAVRALLVILLLAFGTTSVAAGSESGGVRLREAKTKATPHKRTRKPPAKKQRTAKAKPRPKKKRVREKRPMP